MFERLRAAVNAALDAAMPPPDWRDLQGKLRQAAVEGRSAALKLTDALAAAERELTRERQLLDDARRRGAQAERIGDQETVAVAERFTARHAERVAVLEQKVAAQQAELALVERDVAELVGQLKELERRGGVQEVPSTGAVPGVDDDAALGAAMDRAAREADAAARLEELKKRMGR